ncbi:MULTISPECIES: hypothetical protein [Sphingobacterium]|uniref:RNA polymerase sigma factor 70 region 4 type 2 domain-containing protein n=1 Tax=Sphingobacterium tenebrionis TaxID=3111775 RepID=A0ABU8I943_9SPHI|nr:hypothetical protein [Sphingobacterium sp. 1.A.4]
MSKGFCDESELNISKRTVENYITQALAFIRKKNQSAYIVLTCF